MTHRLRHRAVMAAAWLTMGAALAGSPGARAQGATGAGAPRDEFGHATRAALALQVGGTSAGPVLPMPGEEAGAAYKRYLDSFTHPIPEFFEKKVKSGQDDR
ncbi:MAG: DUF3613 domain-containing protein [Janthinobacterium lividum]